MKKYIIDTNSLISFVTDRNLSQQAKVAKLFEDAMLLKVMVLCHQNVITEFIHVMDKVYHVRLKLINTMVQDFIAMVGVDIVHDINVKTLLSYWPDIISDYGDAVIASFCKNTKGAIIATFDRKFTNTLLKLGIAVYPFKNS